MKKKFCVYLEYNKYCTNRNNKNFINKTRRSGLNYARKACNHDPNKCPLLKYHINSFKKDEKENRF